MEGLYLLSYFFGGIFLANAIPHFVSGMMGRPFQSPFAQPPGQGLSSSTVNVLWGFFNIVVGYLLVCRVGDFGMRDTGDVAAFGAGAFLIALFSARHFGRFNGGNPPERQGRLNWGLMVGGEGFESSTGRPCLYPQAPCVGRELAQSARIRADSKRADQGKLK